MSRRAIKRLEARAASLAARHLRPEHVDAALKSLARGLTSHLSDEELARIHPDELDDATIAAHMGLHAGRHPNRAAERTASAPAPAPLDSGIRRNPTEQLSVRQDQLAAVRSGITKE